MSGLEHTRGGRWRDGLTPHHGWTCVEVVDAGDTATLCEMCGEAHIRYVHRMEHPEHTALSVGVICAGKMEGDGEMAQERERTFKNRLASRAKWLKREWRTSAKGNRFINAFGYNVVVFRAAGGFTARVKVREPERDVAIVGPFPEAKAAALAAFDALSEDRKAA